MVRKDRILRKKKVTLFFSSIIERRLDMRQIREEFRGKVMYTNQMIKEKLIKLNTDC